MKLQRLDMQNNKLKSRWSNRRWIITGVAACVVGFIVARIWMVWGFCIPCYIEAGWNGICTWVSTGVNPFW